VRLVVRLGERCWRGRGFGGRGWRVLQDVSDGVSIRQECADVRHPGGRGGGDEILEVVVNPQQEGVGHLLDNRVIADARCRVEAGSGWRNVKRECRGARAGEGSGCRPRVQDGGAGEDDRPWERPVQRRKMGEGRATSEW
jgi:hypothetical protein